MPASLQPRLVNRPFADPGLFLPFRFERRALLFDLGDNAPLAARDLLKVSHAFVSHTHMDHFIGFDRLLRTLLGREKTLGLFGPQGFLDHVQGKLASYSWDLADRYAAELRLCLTEVRPGEVRTAVTSSRTAFKPCGPAAARPFEGLLHIEPGWRVSATILQHSIPCLAFRLEENFHVNVLGTEMAVLGLSPGPWLTRFKKALYAGADPRAPFEIESAAGSAARPWALGELSARIARITPGQTLAYITDAADTPHNRAAMVALARGADLLFIEAAFLHADRERAAAKHHLTARQAGEIAALAGVKQFRVFHFSPRYEGQADALEAEAREAYARTLTRAV